MQLVIRRQISYLNAVIFLASESLLFPVCMSAQGQQLSFTNKKVFLEKPRAPGQSDCRLTHPAKRLYTVLALTKPWRWEGRIIPIFNNTLIRHLTQWTRACVQNSPVMKLTSETFLPPAPIYHFHSRIIESNLPTHDYTSQEIIFHVRWDVYSRWNEYLQCQS